MLICCPSSSSALNLHLIQVAGSVSIVPSDVLNDTAFVVLKFGDETIDNLEFGTRTIYGMNSNFINPEGILVELSVVIPVTSDHSPHVMLSSMNHDRDSSPKERREQACNPQGLRWAVGHGERQALL